MFEPCSELLSFSHCICFYEHEEILKIESWQKLGGTVVKVLVHGIHQEMALGSNENNAIYSCGKKDTHPYNISPM